VNVIAGRIGDLKALPRRPESWAADPANQLAIWTMRIEPGASWKMPATSLGVNRTLFLYRGSEARIDGLEIAPITPYDFDRTRSSARRGQRRMSLLLSRTADHEPIAQYGPFVMNTQEEIETAFRDYRRDQFGGWPWSRNDPVHPRSRGRFATFATVTRSSGRSQPELRDACRRAARPDDRESRREQAAYERPHAHARGIKA